MTAKSFLIAHKVRGTAAFDVAERMKCPICEPMKQGLDDGSAPYGCDECEGEGYWWIVSTSGHRAYPLWYEQLSKLYMHTGLGDGAVQALPNIKLPPNWPDHYPINKTPEARIDPQALLKSLGLGREPIRRRL